MLGYGNRQCVNPGNQNTRTVDASPRSPLSTAASPSMQSRLFDNKDVMVPLLSE